MNGPKCERSEQVVDGRKFGIETGTSFAVVTNGSICKRFYGRASSETPARGRDTRYSLRETGPTDQTKAVQVMWRASCGSVRCIRNLRWQRQEWWPL